MYIHSLLWIDFGYIYIYIVEGKRQIKYKFIPTSLFRGYLITLSKVIINPLMSGQPRTMYICIY